MNIFHNDFYNEYFLKFLKDNNLICKNIIDRKKAIKKVNYILKDLFKRDCVGSEKWEVLSRFKNVLKTRRKITL